MSNEKEVNDLSLGNTHPITFENKCCPVCNPIVLGDPSGAPIAVYELCNIHSQASLSSSPDNT